MADSTLDLRALRQETATPVAPAPEQVLVGPELEIRTAYTDPTGKRHEGVLLSRVLTTVDGRAQVGRIQARLAGAQEFDTMPAVWRAWASAVAICTVQIDKPPDWFEKWMPADDNLLFAVAGKLWDHNDLFFRADNSAGAAPAQPRVVVHAPGLPAPDPASP